MQGLTIIVAAAETERFHAALSVAAANAALGKRTRLFLQGEAAKLLRAGFVPADVERSQHGVPTIAELLTEAQALGAEIIVCQSGLALCNMEADSLPAGVSTGGLVLILSTLEGDQLAIA